MHSITLSKQAFALTALAALFFAPAQAAVNDTATIKRASVRDVKLNQLIVKYRSGGYDSLAAMSAGTHAENTPSAQSMAPAMAQRLASVQQAAQALGTTFQSQRQLATGGWLYRSSKPLTRAQMQKLAQNLMKTDAQVEYAEPDEIAWPTWTPNDPSYAVDQWDMQESSLQPGGLNTPAAWDISKGDGVVVAVLDTGYRPHPDLLPNLVPAVGGKTGQYGYNFISDASQARVTPPAGRTTARGPDGLDQGDWSDGSMCGKDDSSWHGTHVAGTIAAASNNIGITGVAPKARLLPLRVLGQCGGRSSDIAEAIVWASGASVSGVPANPTPAKVINMSLGGLSACSRTYADAIKKATQQGAAVIVAAGNSALDSKLANPGSCPGTITVASTAIDGGRSGFSNYGGAVTVAAPGSDILSTNPTGTTTSSDDSTYGKMSGTSMATPHVAGVAALMYAANPRLTPLQVKRILVNTARPAPANCPGCGAGIVDAAAAVQAALKMK